MQDPDSVHLLTDKEREALRLLLAGHDAKSSARELGVTHHAIHDRLRSARRKLGATSSREAALKLADAEDLPPEPFVHEPIGAEKTRQSDDVPDSADPKRGTHSRSQRRRKGLIIMTITIAFAAIATVALTQGGGDTAGAADAVHPAEEVAASAARSEPAARAFMTMLDQGDARKAYDAASPSFRKTYKYDLFELGVLMHKSTGGAQRRTLVSVERDRDPAGTGQDELEILTFDTVLLNGDRRPERLVMARSGSKWQAVNLTVENDGEE